jgi:hypothetical protein
MKEINMKNIESIKEILIKDQRLIRLPSKGKAVFVGDTHGDFNATKKIFQLYFKPGYVLVFLGDYVDRGEQSRENIEFLLEKKSEAPGQVFLLAGNHEGHSLSPFGPDDFWESLTPHEYESFSEICKFLSFAVITENGLIGVHGVPPAVNTLEEINSIRSGSKLWHQLTWGDFADMPGDFLGNYWGRPLFGEEYFKHIMNRLGRSILVRAHQPHIKPIIFNNRCLTLITSHAYKPIRLIAIADLEKPLINSVDDLEIVKI